MATKKDDKKKDKRKEVSSSTMTQALKQQEFVKELEPGKDLFLLTCKCGKSHFRHAGYMHVLIPFVDPKDGAKVADASRPVQVCIACKQSYIIHDGKVFNVSNNVDLTAWEAAEPELSVATGPGGEC